MRARQAVVDVGVIRVLVIGTILVVALAVQSTLLTELTFLGVIPQLVMIVVVSFAYLDGERVGVTTGFFAGLLVDLLLPGSIVGITALVYTLIGFGVGTFRSYMVSESMWTPLWIVALSSALAEFGSALLAVLLGQRWVSFTFTLKVVGLVVLYNTLLTPFLFPLLRRLATRLKPERIHRL